MTASSPLWLNRLQLVPCPVTNPVRNKTLGRLLMVGTKLNRAIVLLHRSSPAQSTTLKFNNQERTWKGTLMKETLCRVRAGECSLIAYHGAK
jgi:hypothetical protein